MRWQTIVGPLAAAAALTFTLAGCANVEAARDPAAVHEEAASARSPFTSQPAPDFTLPDQNGNPVTLSKLRGQWVVLYFYPKDDTPACTCEATDFTKRMQDFGSINAKVFGISSDSVASHKLFVDKFKFTLDLLSDPDHKVMRQYGAWVDAYLGDKKLERPIRTTFIIDPRGIIRRHWPEVVATGHADRVREQLAKLQAEAKSPPEKAPSPG